MLAPGPQPAGTAYRWQDGSTRPQLEVAAPGRYEVSVVSPAGCAGQAAVQVRFGDGCPFTIPNIITPNGDGRNETFALPGLEPNAWNIQLYNRWGTLVYQQAPYHGAWDAAGQPNGVYYYLLVHPVTGRRYKGWVEVVR
ncbi:hypothetical protein BEN49_14375 [Hymenobacter coccineus]|uniref:Gliding motility-associated C-terminal domain-containing protein n=1 Tax=Hymenobacter coccineus TaxID=1908235 RepID=A0A1G1SUD9_9BACT|nr:hypothetical protein BEN49_14375 [Hymenobacter coccineus]